MADEYSTKRIINLPAESGPAEGDVFVVDNESTGTKKLPITGLIDPTLTQPGQAADAKVVGDRFDGVNKELTANFKISDTAYNTPLSGIYWGTIGSGTIVQVRTATDAYNGILFPIPFGIKSIDFSDMTPYSIRLFDHMPVIGETVSTGKTAVNKILYLDSQNTYTWGIVTLKLSADGNSKESFVIRMNGSVGDRVSNLEKRNFSVVNGRSIPIVCLIYDDNTDGDDTLHTMLESRGLKGTFSTIGNVDPTEETWKAKAEKLQNWIAEGHGVLGHGLTTGTDVTILDGGSLAGISNISDADARKAIDANNKALDDYGLPHNGIAYWNVWEDTPHTRNIVEKYYNYGFTFGGEDAGINTVLTDKFALTRWTTDLSSHMSTALNILKNAIGQKCIVCFGGHMSRTATGEGSYSTLSEFTSFLNQIKEYVDLGLMVSLNTDDAVKMFYGNNKLKGSYPYIPAVGDMVLDNGIKTCISAGSAYFCRVTFTGTPTSGHITIPELDIDVDTYASDSITDIVNRIVASPTNKRYTYQKTSATQVWCYANIARQADSPVATINTSGLTIAFSEKNSGANPVWG